MFVALQNKNNLTGTGTDLGKSYMGFCRGNMDQIEKKIKDDLWVLSTMEVRLLRKCRLGSLVVENQNINSNHLSQNIVLNWQIA